MVLADVAQKARDGYELPAQGVILTDSSDVYGCLVDGWNAKGPNALLVKALLALLRDSPIYWTIIWSGVAAPSAASFPGTPTWPWIQMTVQCILVLSNLKTLFTVTLGWIPPITYTSLVTGTVLCSRRAAGIAVTSLHVSVEGE